MALVALASAKGSPGVTTASLVFGALWPRQVLLAECDPAGSDVAIRMTAPGGAALNSDRGLVSLAAASRKGLGDEVILAHSQQLDGGLDVLLGVRSPEQVGGMGGLWHPLGISFNQMQKATYWPTAAGSVRRRRSCPSSSPRGSSYSCVRRPARRSRICGSGCPHWCTMSTHSSAWSWWRDPKRREGVKQVWTVLDAMSVPVRHRWHLAYDPAGAAFFDGRGHGRLERRALIRYRDRHHRGDGRDRRRAGAADFDMAKAAFPPGDLR